MMSPLAVSVRHLTKNFRTSFFEPQKKVLDDFSWDIEQGQIAALLGPNGSGKSTLLKILLGLLEPDKGTAQLFNIPCAQFQARERVGFLPERPTFPFFLNAKEVLSFYGKLSRVSNLSSKIEELLVLVGLEKKKDCFISTYSQGMRQRLGLAQALIHDPTLLILDEPATGLDLAGLHFFSELLLKLKKSGVTILLTSHLLTHVEETCDHVAIIVEGKLCKTKKIEKRKRDLSSLEQFYLEVCC